MKPTIRFDTLFGQFANPGSPGASAMVIHRGEIIFARGFGLADLERQIPCSVETNFRLASLTKSFTAMAVMILNEQKKLSLDERLPDFFPEFPAYGSAIKLRHLLNHTSGLLDYEDLIPTGTRIPVRDRDVLCLLMEQPDTYFAPGSSYRYSNSAYALLALVVESRSGQTLARFLQQNIFHPLGMHHTLAYEAGLSVVPNRAFGYSVAQSGYRRTDQSLTSSVLGDGGVYSSVSDLFRWDQALYTEQLISRESLRRIFKPAVPTDLPRTGYGMGWFIGRYRGAKEIWHHGETIGFRARIARFPAKRFTAIILANQTEAQLDRLPHRMADLYFSGRDQTRNWTNRDGIRRVTRRIAGES